MNKLIGNRDISLLRCVSLIFTSIKGGLIPKRSDDSVLYFSDGDRALDRRGQEYQMVILSILAAVVVHGCWLGQLSMTLGVKLGLSTLQVKRDLKYNQSITLHQPQRQNLAYGVVSQEPPQLYRTCFCAEINWLFVYPYPRGLLL